MPESNQRPKDFRLNGFNRAGFSALSLVKRELPRSGQLYRSLFGESMGNYSPPLCQLS